MKNLIESICELAMISIAIIVLGVISLVGLYLAFFPITVPLTIIILLISM